MSPRFRVIWKHSVIERTLAAIVVRAMERGEPVAAITAAMAEIDQRLERDPDNEGESRGEHERVLIVSPLTVTFEVHSEEQIVFVLTARYRPRRSPGT